MKAAINLIICLFLGLCLVQAVSAVNFEVEEIEISPSTGDIAPGDRVTVHVTAAISSDGDETFPGDDYLEAYTDLDNLKWVYSIKIDERGEDTTVSKRYLTLNGWLLSYPSDTEVDLEIYLEGKAPSSAATQEIILFRLRQLDSSGDVRTNGEYLQTINVINPEDIETTIELREAELAELRTALDEKAADGVDISTAEAKYDEAEAAINSARTASYTSALASLDNAGTLMDECEDLLDEAWAAQSIADAQARIDEVEAMITYFKDNRSMGSDARVVAIETQLDNAQTLLTLAKDKLTSKDYNQARIQAANAEEKADVAYDAATELKEEIGEGIGFDLSGINIYLIAGVVLVVLVVGGIVLYRRHTKWDELG